MGPSDETRREVTVDELTGLQNRHGLLRAAGPILALADRIGIDMTLGCFDVNGLKTINDEHGREAGDRAIRAAAELLCSCFRAADVVARIGGDEFVVLFAVTDTEGATIAAARLIEAIAAHNAATDEPFQLAIACGFAVRAPRGAGIDRLLEEADAVMYQHKNAR